MHLGQEIFVIDDDYIFHESMKYYLSRNISSDIQSNYFTEAENAVSELLKKIENGEKLPRCIFLDLNMPVMDGWDFLEELEKCRDEKLKKIKIFVITSSISEEDEQKAMDYGQVKGYFVKPISKNKFDNFFQNALEVS